MGSERCDGKRPGVSCKDAGGSAPFRYPQSRSRIGAGMRKSCAPRRGFCATIAQRGNVREGPGEIAQLTEVPARQPPEPVTMNTSFGTRFAARLGVALFALSILQSLPAQEERRRGGERGTERGAERGGERGGDRGPRGDFNPQEMQARMLNMLRERLEITDDEEWKVISERVAKVSEMRRSAGGMGGPGGMMGFRGGPPGGGGDRGPGPGRGGSGNPELSALQFAIRDKLPEAEIKSRLERVRESRRDQEAKLAKAQEELRAVLSVRQEAIAVMFGLLP